MSEAEVQPSTPVEPAGLDAIISTAMDGYGDEPAPAVEKTDDKPTETRADHPSDPSRYADGTFKPTKPAEPEPSVTEPAKAEAKPAEPITADPAPVQPVAPPERWSPEDKAKFSALPREAQEIVSERYKGMEADYTRKTQELAETRKSVEPLIQEVGKWSPYLRQIGLTPDKAFTDMLTTEYTLRTGTPEQKQQSLAYLAQYYGVPIPTAGGGDPSLPDPALTQLHQTVSGLQQQLRQMNEQRVVQDRERAQAEFDALGQAKDTGGQAKFPHFERVKQAMIQLVASGQADTWDSAYSKSVRLDDELYKQTVETERNRVSADAEKARLEAVEKAKKAQPVKSSDGSPKGGAKLTGLDAHISGAMERAGFGD